MGGGGAGDSGIMWGPSYRNYYRSWKSPPPSPPVGVAGVGFAHFHYSYPQSCGIYGITVLSAARFRSFLVGVIVIGIIKREDGWWLGWVATMPCGGGELRVNLQIFGVVGFTSHLPLRQHRLWPLQERHIIMAAIVVIPHRFVFLGFRVGFAHPSFVLRPSPSFRAIVFNICSAIPIFSGFLLFPTARWVNVLKAIPLINYFMKVLTWQIFISFLGAPLLTVPFYRCYVCICHERHHKVN